MGKLIGAITGNPMILLWIAIGAFALGLATGGGGAWWIQGLRLGAVKAEYAGFVATTKAQGEAAQKLADAERKRNKQLKDDSDATYQTTIDQLKSDAQRLRNARASSRYVPAASPTSSRPDLACFDRADLERSIQQLDAEVQSLIDYGDEGIAGLNIGRKWSASLDQ
ncbi:MAG: hypothetical protein P4L87_25260 [Formivibrio sp.]|nr:hypothetical protein [Formivibrio sp.]